MKKLLIESTKCTPEIAFDPDEGKLKIYGSSYPENAYEFYKPVLDWIYQFVEQQSKQIEFDINVQYFDTTSSKCFLEILERLDVFYKKGNDVTINWLYKEFDQDNIDSAEELFLGLNLPYKFVKE